ncbi:MAG: hypothetical protein P8Y42_19780 [Exilibacterium sp.]
MGIASSAFWALIDRIGFVIADIADDPLGFANNLAAALGRGFRQFFDRFDSHLLGGFFEWLFSGLGAVGVNIPSDFSLQSIVTLLDQVRQAAIDFVVETITTQVAMRLLAMFNPAGAILTAVELIYRILRWVFENAARIFSLVETVVNGAADLIAGNLDGMANAIEGALGRLVAPVIDFIVGYFGLDNLPDRIAGRRRSDC